MTNNTTKIITLLAVLIVSATLSGCIGNEPEPKMVKWNNGVIVDSFSEPVPEPVMEVDTVQITEIAEPVSIVITTPTPTIVSTPKQLPTIVSTPVSTPTVIKNEPCERKSYIRQCGGYCEERPIGSRSSIPDNSFSIIIYRDKYKDVEEKVMLESKYPDVKFVAKTKYRVHPDLVSYDVYVSGKLTQSFPAPTIEEYDDRCYLGFNPIVPKEDYPHNVVVVAQYIDGETFEYRPSC